VQGIYENVRCEALANSEPASWALERVRRYGVASLLPGVQPDFPFILCAQSVPRPPWSGTSLAELPLHGNPLSYSVSTNSCAEPEDLWRSQILADHRMIVWANRDQFPNRVNEDTPLSSDQKLSTPQFTPWPR
jgi:hypothetical protein